MLLMEYRPQPARVSPTAATNAPVRINRYGISKPLFATRRWVGGSTRSPKPGQYSEPQKNPSRYPFSLDTAAHDPVRGPRREGASGQSRGRYGAAPPGLRVFGL